MNRSPERTKKKTACRSASVPPIWNQAFAFSIFPIFAASTSASAPLPQRAYGFTALLFEVIGRLCLVALKKKKKSNEVVWVLNLVSFLLLFRYVIYLFARGWWGVPWF